MRQAVRLLVSMLVALTGSQALAQRSPPLPRPGYSSPYYQSYEAPSADTVAARQYRGRLADLQRRALKLRRADGGTLSEQHRQEIQVKLDTIQAAYAPYRTSARQD